MIELTPNVYRNLKWSPLANNQIDTIHVQPILNETEESSHTFEITQVNDATLPISQNYAPTHLRYMYNNISYTTLFGINSGKCCGKARIEAVVKSGSQLIELDTPLEGDLTASIQLSGYSDVIDNGRLDFETYPSVATMTSKTGSIASWIDSHRSQRFSGFSNVPSATAFTFMPWIDDIVSYGTPSSIRTKWRDVEGTYDKANMQDWISYSNVSTGSELYVFPQGYTPDWDNSLITEESLLAPALPIGYASLPITCSVVRVTDRKIRIRWEAPVRIAYAAASCQYGGFGGQYSVDSSAYCDYVEKITITVTGQRRTKNTLDKAYSLDKSGGTAQLTEYPKNAHPYRFPVAENFTTDTKLGSATDPWYQDISERILTTYEQGKYTVTCTVPAAWAIKKNIRVGTECCVRLINSSYVARGNVSFTTFTVMSITKRFQSNEFVFILSLMEV